MSSDLMSAVGFVLSSGWRFLTSITVPGTNIHFAALFVGLFLARLGLSFLSMMMGVSVGYDDILNGVRVHDSVDSHRKDD